MVPKDGEGEEDPDDLQIVHQMPTQKGQPHARRLQTLQAH
jgi:hypothetical protein